MLPHSRIIRPKIYESKSIKRSIRQMSSALKWFALGCRTGQSYGNSCITERAQSSLKRKQKKLLFFSFYLCDTALELQITNLTSARSYLRSTCHTRSSPNTASRWRNIWPPSSARRRTRSTAHSSSRLVLADTESGEIIKTFMPYLSIWSQISADALGSTTSRPSPRRSWCRTCTSTRRTPPRAPTARTWPTSPTRRCRRVTRWITDTWTCGDIRDFFHTERASPPARKTIQPWFCHKSFFHISLKFKVTLKI